MTSDPYEGIEVYHPPCYPEVVQLADDDKEFVSRDSTQAILHKVSATPVTTSTIEQKRGKYRWIFGALALLAVLIAILVPVGLLVIKKDDNKNEEPGSTLSPNPSPNPNAVLGGTRLATIDSAELDIHLYYQSEDGGLHFITQSEENRWQGSRDLQVEDAKLGTPLAATRVVSGDGGADDWWLFYVDESNTIRNIYSRADPTTWHEGIMGKEGYKVPNTTDYAFAMHRGNEHDEDRGILTGGFSLYASDPDGVVHTYVYYDEDGNWYDEGTLPEVDGYSGVGTFWLTSSAYVYSLNHDGSLQFHWREYDNDDGDGEWKLGPTSLAPVMKKGNVCSSNGVAFQADDGTIRGSNFTFLDNAPRARWDVDYDISEIADYDINDISKEPAINGTSLACRYVSATSPEADYTMFHVFYQVEGNGLVEAYRNWGADNMTVPGEWKVRSVPIP